MALHKMRSNKSKGQIYVTLFRYISQFHLNPRADGKADMWLGFHDSKLIKILI